MSLMMPPRFARKAGHLTLASNHGDVAHLFVLEDDAKRDTNSLAISYLEGACSFDEKGFWVALMKGSPRHKS
jgi:hypothetical protein